MLYKKILLIGAFIFLPHVVLALTSITPETKKNIDNKAHQPDISASRNTSQKKEIESKKTFVNKKLYNDKHPQASLNESVQNNISQKNKLIAGKQSDEYRPPGYFLFILLFTAINFIWNIFQFIHNNRTKKTEASQNKRAKRAEIADEYWVRNIAFPICVTPLIKFIEDFSLKLKSLNESDKSNVASYDGKLINFLEEFKAEKESTVKKFYVLSIKWNDVFSVLSEKLDTLDDDVTMHCYINQSSSKSSVKQITKYSVDEDVFYVILGEILSDLSSLHIDNM